MKRGGFRGPGGRAVLPALVLVAAAAATTVYYLTRDDDAIPLSVPQSERDATGPANGERGPLIRHPVPAEPEPKALPKRLSGQLPETLPDLSKSDAVLQDLIDEVLDHPELAALLIPEGIIHRIVITIDNLPKRSLPLRRLPLRQPGGAFLAVPRGDGFAIDPVNNKRYERHVAVLDAVDRRDLAVVYTHFYPLFQEAYEELGYKSGYFNDRVIAAIDDLLETPAVEPPVLLERPAVHYVYANPELERLSAGQRLLLRMGSENASRVKDMLRELRRALTE